MNTATLTAPAHNSVMRLHHRSLGTGGVAAALALTAAGHPKKL
ncbi:hypothetical protein ACQF36_14225 [Streptomyces sp. Marseille-Q5077]